MLYELLIRGTVEGTISGAHVIDFEDGAPGLPRAIYEDDWAEISGEIDALLSAQIATLEAEIVATAAVHATEKQTLETAATTAADKLAFSTAQIDIVDAANESDVDAEEKARAVRIAVRNSRKTKLELAIEELESEIAQKERELARKQARLEDKT
jgi:hypothetical protein